MTRETAADKRTLICAKLSAEYWLLAQTKNCYNMLQSIRRDSG